jgi:hypothetical protein
MHGKNKNIRDLYKGINEFQRGYQPRNNLVKDENGDLLADSHNILNRWKNFFSQLCNVHSVQIPSELIQAGGETLLSVIHKCINFN